MVKKTFTFI